MSSIEKGLKVIIRLSSAPFKMKLTEIAGFLEMSKSATYQILIDLERYNFVFRDQRTKLYQLGPALLRLGYTYDEIKGLKPICLPIMQEIVEKTGFTCYVSIREGRKSFLAYKIDSPKSKETYYRETMGLPQSFNCGSTGKLLAAYLPQGEIDILVKEGLEKRASRSITDKDELMKEYARIRERGYSTAVKEYSENSWGISTPIFDGYDNVVAAIGLVGPLEIFTDEFAEKMIPIMKYYAKIISGQLKYR